MRAMPANPSRKQRTVFVCTDCGHEHPKWAGRCTGCGAWNTLREFAPPSTGAVRPARPLSAPGTGPVPLAQVPAEGGQRFSLGMPEVDRLLGGGVVCGGVLLMAGEPGVGKSTLLLQAAARVAAEGRRVLYVSGEESGAQVRLRARRLGVEDSGLLFLAETDAEAVLSALEDARPSLAIVDSIQTLASAGVPSTAGSVAQVRECAQLLLAWAKRSDCALFLTGHVTKDGQIGGPRVLEHMVDVVLSLDGAALGGYRLARCVKNRYGSTNDVALLEMGPDGLSEVADPSAALIGERQAGVPGSAVVVSLEGSRPLLCEVQALTTYSTFTPPRRSANGLDFNRMALLAAVLTRRAGVPLSNQDIMVNVPGGLHVSEPAADLGTALAIASSFRDVALDPRTVCIGEVGLNGEVRRVPQLSRRLAEAARHGFKRALVPAADLEGLSGDGLEAMGVSSLREAIGLALPGGKGAEGPPYPSEAGSGRSRR
jgi:DNA repair protein RadA/Sms